MKHISHTATIAMNAPPDEVFPLFTPVGERLWISTWNPEYVYPESGEAATGTIFKTAHGEVETIWVTVNYDVEQHVATYINVTPEVQVIRIDIQCHDAPDAMSTANVTYTHTALSEHGQTVVETVTEAHFRLRMSWWEKAINHYLQHGQPLPHH